MKNIKSLIFVLAFCRPLGHAAPAPETTKLVYALPAAVPAALAYVAVDKGFFKKEGLDVEAKMFSSGREALQMLLAGQAQLQSVSETPVVHAIIQGNKIVTVATIAEHGEAKVLVRKERVGAPADLRGKKVATLPGTNSDYFMYQFLAKHGLAPGDLKIANMPPPEMVVAFAKGDIDAYFAWEPHIFYGKRKVDFETQVFNPGRLYWGRTTVNMDPDFAAKNPETVRRVLRALLQSEKFVRANPGEAAAVVAKRLSMDKSDASAMMEDSVYKVQLDRGTLELMEKVAQWALEQKGLSKNPAPDIRAHLLKTPLSKEKPSVVDL